MTPRTPRRAFGLAVALTAGATLAAGLAVSGGPATAAPASTTITVATFNIGTVSSDKKARGEHRPWKVRLPVVAKQILSRRPDVLGVQEANQASVYPRSMTYGVNQFMDLKGALRARGGSYSLTNEHAYNCARSTSSRNCRYQNRGAAQDNRIFYNNRTVRLVRGGAVRFRAQTAGKNDRYLAWAVFAAKRTGRQFFVANTHLDPYSIASRQKQWGEVISSVNRLKGSLPVVVLGDFNTSKFDTYAARFLPAMRAAGYGDVVGQTYKSAVVSRPRPESMKRAWISSFNAFRRDVRVYSYDDARHKVGNGIDWIFASNRARVRSYEVVSNLDPRTLRLRGVIPSDHSMVRATLTM